MKERRILLTGGTGLLGQALLPGLFAWGEVRAPAQSEVDLNDPATVHKAISEYKPHLLIHLAAQTHVDQCEGAPEETLRVNARGTAHVAIAAAREGARVVLLSTDYVFDGGQRVPYREYQTTAPLNVYGRSKEEAERAVLSVVEDSLVVRSASLFGHGGRNFVNAILERGRRGESLQIVNDQVQSPTWVQHLATAVIRAAVSDMKGILHLTARGGCTWFEFAQAILTRAGLTVSCEPISSARLGRPARRPAYSVLETRLAEETLGVRIPDWHEGLAAYLDEALGS